MLITLLTSLHGHSRVGYHRGNHVRDRGPFLCAQISTYPAMAPKPMGDRKRDRLMKFLHLQPWTPQPTEFPPPPQLADNVEPTTLIPHDTSSKPQKVFTKGNSFKRDMAILSIAYIIQESSELKRLIQLIVVIRDKDSEGQVMPAMSCISISDSLIL